MNFNFRGISLLKQQRKNGIIYLKCHEHRKCADCMEAPYISTPLPKK